MCFFIFISSRYYVNSLTIFGSFITHIAIHAETLFCVKQEEEIFEKLKLINGIFVEKLNHEIDFKTRFINYIQTTVGTFVLTVIFALASSLTPIPDLQNGIEIHFMKPIQIIAVIIIRSRWCYIALFLHSIADTLNDLQVVLKQQQLRSFDESNDETVSNETREKIRYFREIYSNIWFIVVLSSDCFGWSLITFLIEMTFELINASYWLYINVHVYGSINLNIRKIFVLILKELR